MRSIPLLVFIGLFYAVGFGMLWYGLMSARRSNAAAAWSTANGTLTKCSLENSSDGDGGTTYQVKVEYNYSVHGRQFTGSRLAFGYNASSGEDAHEQIYQTLHNAKTVIVRYDPAEPSVSTLSYGVHRSIQFTLVFAITWLAFMVGFSAIAWISAQQDNVLLKNLIVR